MSTRRKNHGGALVDGQRNPYGITVRLANTITNQLDEFGLSFVGGSVARVMETCGDIDLVFLPTDENSLFHDSTHGAKKETSSKTGQLGVV